MPAPKLLTVEEVRGILDFKTVPAVYKWLRRHGVPVNTKRVSAELFYNVWERQFDPESVARRVLGS